MEAMRVKANHEKFKFAEKEVLMLGHHLDEIGSRPNEDAIKAWREYDTPRSWKAVRRFTGGVTYFKSHIPGLSIHLKDLHAVENCREKFAWTKELDESFMKAKEAVCKAMRTYRIDNSKPLMLFTDASQEKVAAALVQKADNEEDSYVPIAFFSKLLPKRVKPLPAIVIETRAIQQAILHLSKVIDGREVIIYSDHKPLTTCKKLSENIEVEMLMEEMARRGMRICYRKGSKNELADALSCATCKSLKVSEEDRIVQTIKLWRTLYDKENNEDNSIDETIGVVNEGVVSKKIKEIPEEIKKVFQKYHDQLGHPSYERSFIMIDRELVKVGKSISRKKVRKMYREFLTQCEICARLRERRKDRERNLGRHEKLSMEAMDELQMDLLGPVKGSVNDYQHVLGIVDRATRYLFLINLRTKSTEEIHRKLMERVIGIFGMPRTFTSDKAKLFEGLKNKGIPISFGCAQHHESQALIERTFRTIEKCFKAMTLQMNESSWDNLTAMVCLNYNLSYHTVLRERPAKLFLSYVSRQPFEDGDDVSKKYNYSLERQNEIGKACRVSYEILKALQESPTTMEEEFRIG
uniref:Integrase catalytic domain-containing protein n=1 Tax=Strongyloides venezuelensis TaxID=75913 RepID=A0A0K0G3I4_STRVS